MFLFKNTKNLVKRIIMNVAVYGWISSFVTMLLTIILPDNFHEIFYYLIVISSFSALIGTVVSIVWSIVEFFVNILSGNKGSNPTSTKSVYPATSAKVEAKHFSENTEANCRTYINFKPETKIDRSVTPVKTEEKTFTCSRCGESLPLKYLHRNGICASCATEFNNVQSVKTVYKNSFHDIILSEIQEREVTSYIALCKDCEGYYVGEYNHKFGFGSKEKYINISRLEDLYFENYSLTDFIEYIKNQYPSYSTGIYAKATASKSLKVLFGENTQPVKPVENKLYTDIKLGEKFDGGFTEYYISLRKDIKGYYIYENSWHYNAGVETQKRILRLDNSFMDSASFDDFTDFVKKNYSGYETERYMQDNKELEQLFVKTDCSHRGNKGSNPTVTKPVYPATSAKVENKAQNSVPEDKEAHFNFGKNREDIIADRYVHKISRENHILYNLFQVPPADGWEIAIIGLDILNGKPYRNDSRQKCYGVTTACEDSWLPLTYDEVRQLAATVSFSGADLSDLNDRTWTEYIPKEFIEKSQPKPVLPQVYPCEKFSESRSLDIDAISVYTTFRFGENYQFLRKCSTGYRVFSASGERFYKMFPDCPTEEYLCDVLNGKIRVGDVEAHDRLLNEDEVKYFAELIYSCGLYLSPKFATQTIDISIYGGEQVRAYYYKDSKQIPCACKTVYDIGSEISICAQRGIKKEFNKEIILKQPQRYRSVATINECNTGVSEFINYTPEKAYETGYDSYSLYIDIENGDFVFVHSVLEHVGAAYNSRIIFAECIDYDTVRNILSYEIDCLKSLAAKQEDDGIHNESIELRCKEIEKVINTSPADWRKLIFEENENRCICERCKKIISESESMLTDNHRFCKQCASPTQNSDKHLKDKVSDTIYQARMDFERGGSPSFESSLGNRGMFTCSRCGESLPLKYLHSNNFCASCAAKVTQPRRKVKEVFYKAIGKCSNCGEVLTMSNQNKSLCISCEWAQDKFSDNKEIFKMRTNDNRYLDLSYSGHSRYSPNRSSANGYGSDDWMYLCEENGTRFLLMFSDNAEYGTGWMCTELLIGDFENLIKENANYWISIAHSKERTKTYLIHLTEADSVRHLLPTSSRFQSKLTDEHYLR